MLAWLFEMFFDLAAGVRIRCSVGNKIDCRSVMGRLHKNTILVYVSKLEDHDKNGREKLLNT